MAINQDKLFQHGAPCQEYLPISRFIPVIDLIPNSFPRYLPRPIYVCVGVFISLKSSIVSCAEEIYGIIFDFFYLRLSNSVPMDTISSLISLSKLIRSLRTSCVVNNLIPSKFRILRFFKISE